MSNFDFGGHIDDENKFEEMPMTTEEEDCMSPYGVLCASLGRLRARKIFATLEKIARRVADKHGGKPAIVFETDGGEFVSIIEPQT